MTRLLISLLAVLAIGGIVGAAAAAEPIGLSVGYDSRKMTREQVARKAVEAMSEQAKFPFAEVTKDGNARGWNDKTSMLVLSFPMPDAEKVFVVVVAAGEAVADTEHARDLVRSHVFEGPFDADSPNRVVPKNGKVPECPYKLTWKTEERGAVNLLRLFDAAAAITLEKKGYQTRQAPGKALAFSPTRGVFAFLSPTAVATTVGLNMVVATKDDKSGTKIAEDLLAAVVKLLYE